MNADIPHFYTLVRREYLYDLRAHHGEFELSEIVAFSYDCDDPGASGYCVSEGLISVGANLAAYGAVAAHIAAPNPGTASMASGATLGAWAATYMFVDCLERNGFYAWAGHKLDDFQDWYWDVGPSGGIGCPQAESYEPGGNAWKHAMDNCASDYY